MDRVDENGTTLRVPSDKVAPRGRITEWNAVRAPRRTVMCGRMNHGAHRRLVDPQTESERPHQDRHFTPHPPLLIAGALAAATAGDGRHRRIIRSRRERRASDRRPEPSP